MKEEKFMGHRVLSSGKIFGKRNPNVTLKPYLSHGKLAFKINRETHYLHRIVAEVFKLDGFVKDDKSQIVLFKDGDSKNCSLDNLYVQSVEDRSNDLMADKTLTLGRGYKTSIYPYVYAKGDRWVCSYRGKYLGTFENEDEAHFTVEEHRKLVEMVHLYKFDGLYKVNRFGDILSVRYNKVLSQGSFDGSVSLTGKDGKRVKRSIGLLTYNSFNRKNPVKKVTHIDGDVMNNMLVNLKPEKR